TGDGRAAPASFRPVDPAGGSTLPARAALGHATAALLDGTVLITGGAPAVRGLPSGIAYGGASPQFADGRIDGAPPALTAPPAFHAATTLPDGRVLIAGGCMELGGGACLAGAALATTEIYDPASGGFHEGPALAAARWNHDAVLRGDGRVLLVGGLG